MADNQVLEKPTERSRETCELMGIAEKYDLARPQLETFMVSEVANGETGETKLNFDGLLYLRMIFVMI